MASHLHTITFDALDPYAQALWWSEVLAVPMSPQTAVEAETQSPAATLIPAMAGALLLVLSVRSDMWFSTMILLRVRLIR